MAEYKGTANSKGIYSLKDGWLKEPENTEIPDINQSDVDTELQPYIERFDDIIIDGTVEDINSLIDDIYLERQSSILKDGEFAIPNLMFKEFRANGYLQKLRDRKVELENKAMSINDSVNPDLVEMFLNNNTLSEELIEYNNGGVEFRFPEIKDTLAVYLQWEGIYGFDQLILDNKDLFEDDLEELLSYEGVIGYARKIKKILEGEACFCWDMEMSDFRNICNSLDLNPEEAEFFDGETLTEDVNQLKVPKKWRVTDHLGQTFTLDNGNAFYVEEDIINYFAKQDDMNIKNVEVIEYFKDDEVEPWMLDTLKKKLEYREQQNKKEEDYNLNIVNLRDGKETIETVDTVVDGDLAVKLDKDIDGLWAEKDFDIILDEDKKFTRDDIKDFVLIALPGDRKGSKKDLSIEKVSARPSDMMLITWGVSGEHQMERYMGNVVATSNNREELLNIAKDLIKKNKEIYRLHYATMIDYLYRLNGRPATEKEKKQFEKELYESLDEAKEKKIYTVVIDGPRRSRTTSGTLEELIDYFGYTLEKGYSWQHEKGRHKINRNPKTIDSLIDNLNWASDNAAANGYSDTSYYLDEDLNNKDKEDETENNDYLSKEEKEILKGLPHLKFDGDLDESLNEDSTKNPPSENNKVGEADVTFHVTKIVNDAKKDNLDPAKVLTSELRDGALKDFDSFTIKNREYLRGYNGGWRVHDVNTKKLIYSVPRAAGPRGVALDIVKDILNESLNEKIVKKGSKYQVQSEKGRNMGTYDTKEEAEERLKEVEMFKHMNESYVVYTDDYFEDGERSYVADMGDGWTSNGATNKAEAKVFNTEKEAQEWINKINNEYDSNPELERFTYGIEKLNKDFDLTKAPSDLSSKEYEDWYRYAMNNLEEWQKENSYSDFILPDVPDTPLYDNRFKTDLRKYVPGYKGKSNREIINKLKKLSFEERQELKDTYRKDYLKRESKEEKQMKVLKEDYDDTRAKALADYLGVDVEDIEVSGYDDIFAYGKDEYYVLDYDEAIDKAKRICKDILDDLGVSDTFTKSFLDHIKRFCPDDSGKVEDFIEQEIEYYKNEEPDADQVEYLENLDSFGRQEYIINLLGEEEFLNEFLNLDEVASEAVEEDGPAHFISTYNGEEIDLNQNGLYAYRIN